MTSINFKKEVSGGLEGVVQRVTEVFHTEGFGILMRIDLHANLKEKLGKGVDVRLQRALKSLS